MSHSSTESQGLPCRNMDIVGVPEISAEAELLSAIVAFLERVGLGPADVCIKVSSRKVLQVETVNCALLEEKFLVPPGTRKQVTVSHLAVYFEKVRAFSCRVYWRATACPLRASGGSALWSTSWTRCPGKRWVLLPGIARTESDGMG